MPLVGLVERSDWVFNDDSETGNRVWVDKGGNRKTLGYHVSGVQTAVRERLRGGPGRFQASFVMVYSDNVARAQPSNAELTTHSVDRVSNPRCCFHESL